MTTPAMPSEPQGDLTFTLRSALNPPIVTDHEHVFRDASGEVSGSGMCECGTMLFRAVDGGPDNARSIIELFKERGITPQAFSEPHAEIHSLRTQLRRAEGVRDASGDAERWRGLCTFVDFAGHSGGGYVVLFSHKGIGDDPPNASIQIVESFQNPHKVRVYKEGWDLPAAYDALVPGYLPKDLNSLPAARVVEVGNEPWPVADLLTTRANAADILHERFDFDGDGWEVLRAARDAARDHAATLAAAKGA